MLGRTRIALLAGIFAIGFAGCGGDDGTIPKSDSESLLSLLATLEQQIDSSECTIAEGTVEQIDAAVAQLPSEVDPEVQDALNKATENLANLTPEQCGGTSGAQGVLTTDEDATTDETSTTVSTTSTTTTTTPTTDEDTTEPPPTEDQNQEPPTGNNGNGGPNPGPQGGGNDTGSSDESGGLTPPSGKR